MFRTLALVFALSASVAAQDPGKQAVAAVKAAGKLAVKDFREQVKATYENFETSLATLEENYANEDLTWDEAASAAISNLVILQIELTDALPAAVLALFEGPVQDAIGSLGVPADEVPLDLVLGSGGTLDDVRDALRAVVDKQLGVALKRLRKTAKQLDKQDDVVLLLRTRRVDGPDEYTVGQGVRAFQLPDGPIVIHTLGSASKRGTPQDGLLAVAGWGWEGTVTVECGVQGLVAQDTSGIDPVTHAWGVFIDNLPELNYSISARLNDDDVVQLASFGVP